MSSQFMKDWTWPSTSLNCQRLLQRDFTDVDTTEQTIRSDADLMSMMLKALQICAFVRSGLDCLISLDSSVALPDSRWTRESA